MSKMTRKIGFALGAALSAIVLFGLGKVWAHNGNQQPAAETQQTVSTDKHLASTATAPAETAKVWRRGRR